MNELVTPQTLGEYATAITLTNMLTQFVKNIPGIKRIPTQIVSVFLAYIVLVVSAYLTGKLSTDFCVLNAFNAVVVSFAANGVYSVNTREPSTNRTESNNPII